ncbi:MAG: OmpA family protein [Cyclobacteriaceae bacterium]|nr:OmpA family protein [Cyclobacteriaceae bacterium]
MKYSFVLFFLVGNSVDLFAQNLVPNSGFEEFTACPGGHTQSPNEFRVKAWSSGSQGTPDHFHTCSVGEADVPHNWAGVSDAFEGNGYAGIYVWSRDRMGNSYREYLHTRLLSPLIPDSTYSIEFRYKLSSYSMLAADRIGLLLTDSVVKSSSFRPFHIVPTLNVVKDSSLTNKTGLWELARGEYKAKGGEEYIVIGNFYANEQTKCYPIKFRSLQQEMLRDASYYYIDNVQLTPKYLPDGTTLDDLIPEFSPDKVKINTHYVLRNIRFEFDSYKLLSSSFEELDDVVNYLMKNPHTRVELAGHTDDVGNDRYNLVLSRNRARSAARYLTLRGIEADRIESFGYGKSRPLLKATTEEARKINRRVEIRFSNR